MLKALWKVAPKYISKEGLVALRDYKYSAEDHSILKKLFLGKYWDWCAERFPMWMAPNLITLIGFLCLLSNFFLAFYYCPSVVGCTEVPTWLFFYVAISLFIYQTMDNVDGKQARRTNSASPLGELFDHGCDSLFLLLTGFPFFSATRTNAWLSFLFLTEGVFAFYFSHWEEYHTGKLIMGVLANPTEIQYAIMICFIASGIIGPAEFEKPLSIALPDGFSKFIIEQGFEYVLEWKVNALMLTIVGACISLAFISFAITTWKASIKNKEAIYAPILRLFPLIFETLALTVWARWSKLDVLNNQTAYFLSLHGLLFSYLCDQLLLARICKLRFDAFNPILIFPILGALNVSPLFKTPLVDEKYALPWLFSIFFVIYVYFIISVIYQFAEFLNINVLTIKKRKTKTN